MKLHMAALAAGSALLAGCATVSNYEPPPALIDAGEATYQAEHIVDTLQTYHGAGSDPCFVESDPVTRRLIGPSPSHAGVLAWGVGEGVGHYLITKMLIDHDHPRLALIWEAVSVGATAGVVSHNFSIGIRIGRPNIDNPTCPYIDRDSGDSAPKHLATDH